MTTTERRRRFESLIHEAERLMKTSPRFYRVKLTVLAALGYAVLFGMLVLLLAIVAFAIWVAIAGQLWWLLLKAKIFIGVLVLAYVIARALWVRIADPSGYELSSSQCPRFFSEVEALRQRVNAPRIHRIVLTNEFNAGIAQVPRLGVFGWPRNTLVIGLQLLLCLAPQEARAVIAHEMGHLSGRHNRFNGWIYRVRAAWYRTMSAFGQAQHWATRGLARFFDWYAPYFNAHSCALARANEYQADAIAAELTSPLIVASALVNSSVRPLLNGQYYWHHLMARADSESTPPSDPMSGLMRFMTEDIPDSAAWKRALDQVIARETDHADTHPTLRDRLKALEEYPLPTIEPIDNAAKAWLGGENLERILKDSDQQWIKENAVAWKQRYEQVGEARRKLAEFRQRSADDLTQEERWNVATWTEVLDPATDALLLYRSYQASYPHDRAADLAIGRLLIQRGDPIGLEHLEKASRDSRLALTACQLAYGYALSKGDKPLAEYWRLRGECQFDQEIQALKSTGVVLT